MWSSELDWNVVTGPEPNWDQWSWTGMRTQDWREKTQNRQAETGEDTRSAGIDFGPTCEDTGLTRVDNGLWNKYQMWYSEGLGKSRIQ